MDIKEVSGKVSGFKEIPWKKDDKEGIMHFVEFESLHGFSSRPVSVLIPRDSDLALYWIGNSYVFFISAVADGSFIRIKAIGAPEPVKNLSVLVEA